MDDISELMKEERVRFSSALLAEYVAPGRVHSSVQLRTVLQANRHAMYTMFDCYANSLTTAKRARSVSRTRASSESTDSPSKRWQKPVRLLSLAHLYQLCQDFGVLPDVCDMATVQARARL